MSRRANDGRVHFDELIPNRLARWLLYFGFWTLIGLVNFGTALTGVRRGNPAIPLWEPLTWEMSSAYVWGLYVVPLIVYAAHRLQFRKAIWKRVLLAHFALTIPVSLLHVGGMVVTRKVVYAAHDRTYEFSNGNLGRELQYEYYKDLQTYWTIVLITFGFEYYNRYRERNRLLTEAQLQNLREQINPHFLFNTLNMISSKMYEDVSQADLMITRLSDLLRMTLRTSRQPEVPLRTDLEALDLYLEIMRSRFADGTHIEMNIGPEARDALAPNLILQPLVENAFRHGGGKIVIGAQVNDHTLTLRVRDGGPGFRHSREDLLNRGFGLSNTARRLEQLYGEDHQLHFHNCEGGGAEVVIRIPYRPAQ